ncbi:hypothetical protein PR202_gb12159 [Eleusine coracana subsp. coracana]|uniref:F-box domain-containing protein n=1 Tax=Eleusine coracana subsp. coracana TaxID=191504 RepID=A0AAV5EQP7_ELECO|nr:hypothetical protein QOZ80_7BG0585580 [Eleusine coracana subsp. coracana]GJN24421.1 hypothetical protein PR202_gb12159 [Eleusine coracana subsp. coracana]
MERPGPAGRHLDRISALPDELLHVILSFLGDAPAVTRTAALSRRWRHVWTGATNLTFKDSNMNPPMNKSQFFAGFVDWVLARRASTETDMESLMIHLTQDTEKGRIEKACPSPEQLNEWLRYAARHVTKSVHIHLNPSRQVVVELPSHGRAASTFLHLPYYRFRFPAAAESRYQALTDLMLSSLSFDEDAGGSTLRDFVACSCPRLRRLLVCNPQGLRQLVLRSKVLEEFTISVAMDLQFLDVAAPNLRVIDLYSCFGRLQVQPGSNDDKLVRIAAPKLEKIVSMNYFRNKPTDLDIHDLKSVRRLAELKLEMHGKYHWDKDVSFWLLENCPSVEHVDAYLLHGACTEVAMDEQLVDLTSQGRAPFAKVRTMVVRASYFPKDHFVASMSSLLVRCPHLTSLSIWIWPSSVREKTWSCFCDVLTDKWQIHGNVALESLEDVNITGFGGTEEEMQFVRLLFESSSSIKHMTLVHAPAAKKKEGEEPDRKDIERVYHELVNAADLGSWRLAEKTFIWTCDATS